ncbi:phosphotransferase [Actibacterium sp. MT2.3-13A]|uniref:phosphotransferase n=1 Tax=Actibacterium sp. MT2.3-13A TaxID=2828332 RepID=UPI001BA90272
MPDTLTSGGQIPGGDPLLAGLLGSQPPRIDEAAASRLLAEHFGIDATAREVACERDQNFHAVATDGRGYALKIANPQEERLITSFQTEALLWLERADPGLPVPKMVPALDGRHEITQVLPDGRESVVRVITWLEGTPLHRAGLTPETERNIGRVLARIGAALRDFHHPGEGSDLLWDIRHAPRLRPLLSALPEGELGRAVRAELDHYAASVLPRIGHLRRQVVHNDLNHHNVMVCPDAPSTISGVIDFGDMVNTYLAVDVAVAASYLADRAEETLAPVARMIGAYHGVTPLLADEIAVMRDLIVARLVTSIVITGWRAKRYPENAAYILRNNGPARRAMEHFARLDRAAVTAALMRACDME